jgi:hypothetical protein
VQYSTHRLCVYGMGREENACSPCEIRLQPGDCQAHSREEQWCSSVKEHVADVEPERLQPRHLVVGSANNERNYTGLYAVNFRNV